MDDSTDLKELTVYVPEWVSDCIDRAAMNQNISAVKVASLFFMKVYASKMSKTVLASTDLIEAVDALLKTWETVGKRIDRVTSMSNQVTYDGGTIDDMRYTMGKVVDAFDTWEKERIK